MQKIVKGNQVVVTKPNGVIPTGSVLTVIRDDHPTHTWLHRKGTPYVLAWNEVELATPDTPGYQMTAAEWQTLHELERYKWERRWLRIRVFAIPLIVGAALLYDYITK